MGCYSGEYFRNISKITNRTYFRVANSLFEEDAYRYSYCLDIIDIKFICS